MANYKEQDIEQFAGKAVYVESSTFYKGLIPKKQGRAYLIGKDGFYFVFLFDLKDEQQTQCASYHNIALIEEIGGQLSFPYPDEDSLSKYMHKVDLYYLSRYTNKPQHQSSSDYPHICPNCAGPSYNGLNWVDCKRNCGI